MQKLITIVILLFITGVVFSQTGFVITGKITEDEALKNADSANNVRLRIKLNDDGLKDSVPNEVDVPVGKKSEAVFQEQNEKDKESDNELELKIEN